MKKIVLTSCGIINEDLKKHFYKLLDKDINNTKLLFIKIASEGELDPDTSWIEEEYQSILDLGVKAENITEFEYDKNIKFTDYDVLYMLGGNTFYLMKKLKELELDKQLKDAINKGVVYIGSSAGSVIMGKSIETSLPYDENWVNLENFSGLDYVEKNIIPHANRKQEHIIKLKEENILVIELYDDYGIVIEDDKIIDYNK